MYVSGYLREIDFGAFLDVPASCMPRSRPVVKVFEDGRIQLYGQMRKRAAERHSFRARISPDGRYFALYPEPTGNIRFRADGSSLHHEKLAWLLQRSSGARHCGNPSAREKRVPENRAMRTREFSCREKTLIDQMIRTVCRDLSLPAACAAAAEM